MGRGSYPVLSILSGPGRVIAAGTAGLCATALAVAAPAGAAAPSHNPIGHLDSATFTDGAANLSGWTIDPDTAHSNVVTLRVDGKVALRSTADLPRRDVAHAFPKYGRAHGFVLRMTVSNGRHTFCVTAGNLGAGSAVNLGCQTIAAANNPVGALTAVTRQPGGIGITGWALDPNTTGPAQVRITIDGANPATVAAAGLTSSLPPLWRDYGRAHGIAAVIPAPAAAGSHTVCLTALNTGPGADTPLGCSAVVVTVNPVGHLAAVTRTAAGTVRLTGWALDPDAAGPVNIRITANGVLAGTLSAGQPMTAPVAGWSEWGTLHAFAGPVTVPAAELTTCASVINVASGTDTALGCVYVPTWKATVPPAPRSLSAAVTTKSATIRWTPPVSDGGAAILHYQVSSPGLPTQILPPTATRAVFNGLTSGHGYAFTVTADNMLGGGVAASVRATTTILIPAQVTPAPVSTSHYPRNWTTNATATASVTRRLGAVDAGYNPSGHRYLVLMDLGGQTGGGIMLSATSTFVPYSVVARALESYLDGYASTQRQNAPLTLAIGTNNDINVDAADGALWARAVVDPVRAYAARYPAISVVGADDMEPGFSAGVAETRAWLSGYLAATTAPFVFNGSADGCSPSTAGSRCNNGWTEGDLQWLAGGAAPTRISVLPQIYNSAMPWQWRNISLTGLGAHRPRLNFGGPLTEWSACARAACSSLSNVSAWAQLWTALNSTGATRQPEMPFGTDLMIN